MSTFQAQLQILASTDFNSHWLLSDINGKVKVIPKTERVEEKSMISDQEMTELEKGIDVISKKIWKDPLILKKTKNLDALLTFEAHLLQMTASVNTEQVDRVKQALYRLGCAVIHVAKDLQDVSLEALKDKLRNCEARDLVDFLVTHCSFPEQDLLSILMEEKFLYKFPQEKLKRVLLETHSISVKGIDLLKSVVEAKFLGKDLERLLFSAVGERNLDLIACIWETNRIKRSSFLEILAGSSISSDNIIQLGEKIGDAELFIDFAEFFYKKIGRGRDDALCFKRFNPRALEKVKRLIEHQYPIYPETISHLLYSQNYACMNLVFQHVPKEWIEDNAEHILEKLMELEHPKIGALLLKYYPSLPSKCTSSLLSRAISDGNDWFVDWVLTNGMKLDPTELPSLVSSAKNSRHLKIIKSLCEQAKLADATFSYPELLELEQIEDTQELLTVVTGFAFTSSLRDLYELVALYPRLGLVLPEALELTSLMVRFPNLHLARQINPFQDMETYITESRHYALENRDFLKSCLPKLKELRRDELLNAIILNRYNRMKKKDDKYIKKQIDDGLEAHTALMKFSFKEIFPFPTIFSVCTGVSRYAWCLRHLDEICFDEEKQEWHHPNASSIQYDDGAIKGFRYLYSFNDPDENKSHSYPMTFLNENLTRWFHTPSETIKALQNHLENLHKEIVDYPLDLIQHSNKQTFFKKVARSYCLIATLCEIWRGTPHNAMIWLNAIYEHHHLPPPIPKMDHFFLDNTMLVLPIEKAIEDWDSFFEPTLDRALPNELDKLIIMKILLQQNGMILRLCSEDIRNDKDLAIVAIQQNQAAFRYLSKNLQEDRDILQIYSANA